MISLQPKSNKYNNVFCKDIQKIAVHLKSDGESQIAFCSSSETQKNLQWPVLLTYDFDLEPTC